MIRIEFMNKADAMSMLPRLFDILYDNMHLVAPTGKDYYADRQEFLDAVGPALEKEPRQILLIYADDHLAGFCQYYIHKGILMVEELQMKREYQATTLFACLYRFLRKLIPDDTHYIEAWADLRNSRSRRLMEKLGMQPVELLEQRSLIHYRGDITKLQ